jgi:hypothetical protein
MTGYQSKRAAAQGKLAQDAFNDWWGSDYDDSTNPCIEGTPVYWAWAGWHAGKKTALAGREWNFCERCGKRTADLTVIHTCTPPQENT